MATDTADGVREYPIGAIRELVEATAADDGLSTTQRIRELSLVEQELDGLRSLAAQRGADLRKVTEARDLLASHQMLIARENAEIREALVGRSMATPDELDDLGLYSNARLDRMIREGTIGEALESGKLSEAIRRWGGHKGMEAKTVEHMTERFMEAAEQAGSEFKTAAREELVRRGLQEADATGTAQEFTHDLGGSFRMLAGGKWQWRNRLGRWIDMPNPPDSTRLTPVSGGGSAVPGRPSPHLPGHIDSSTLRGGGEVIHLPNGHQAKIEEDEGGWSARVTSKPDVDGQEPLLTDQTATGLAEQLDRWAKDNPEPPTGPKHTVSPGGMGRPGSDAAHPIDVGDDVQRAAELIANGEHVRLNQPRQVSTLLDKLREMVDEAKAAGADAPNFDLCRVSVKDTNLFCAEHQGIPRVEMPQLKGDPVAGSPGANLPLDGRGEIDLAPEFRAHLMTMGVDVVREVERADHLKATQRELNGVKVAGIAGALDAGANMTGTIFISREGYVLDGHHRWAAEVARDLADNKSGDITMNVERVDMGITELLAEANKFASDMGIPQKAVGDQGEADNPVLAEARAAQEAMGKALDKWIDSRADARPSQPQQSGDWQADLDGIFASAQGNERDFAAVHQAVGVALDGEVARTDSPGSFQSAADAIEKNADKPFVLVGAIKGRPRAEEKCRPGGKYDGNSSRIGDVLRSTVVVPTTDRLVPTLEQIEAEAQRRGWRVGSVEDKLRDPGESGYRDIALSLVGPDGHVSEIQISTRNLFLTKPEGHKFYEEERALTEGAVPAEFGLRERARLADLMVEQRKLYGPGWLADLVGPGMARAVTYSSEELQAILDNPDADPALQAVARRILAARGS